jgi:tetratricopeptide (TPR) repeat protein
MGQEGQRGFSAFVSYSHADKAAAQKLHRRLEGYRLPKHVAAQLAATTPSDDPTKLGQIFRDREDLPAAQDLSESVKAALQVSAALIVLCSPAAKASKWVAREIETFRELHPDRPILAALLEGEPEEAFPEPLLQGREPLAADLRKEGDGPRLGFLKVVAGIAGVPLDALVQRDAQRRMRRVMLVTAGAVTAMLAMAIMTVVAIQSRNEAQRQRAEAEGLVEYMLTDLRMKMEDVGRLDVMTDVNERAMKYYEAQGSLEGLPPDSLVRRALTLRKMGEDDEKARKFDAALEKFKEAHRTTAALVANNPNNPKHILAHLYSENWLGYYTDYRGKLNEAESVYRRSKTLSDRITGTEKDNEEWIRQTAFMHGNMCTAHLSQKKADTKSALDHCKKALAGIERLTALNPSSQEMQLELAVRNAWLGETLLADGKMEEGLKRLRNHLKIVDGLVASEPKNIHWQGQRAGSYMGMAEQFAKYGRYDEAKEFADKAHTYIGRLIAHDRENKEWPKWLERLQAINFEGGKQ